MTNEPGTPIEASSAGPPAAGAAGQAVARVATVEDLPGMLDVIEAAFPIWPPIEVDTSNAEHLHWKLGPDGEAAIGEHILVELDGRVVAVRLKWAGEAQLGDANYSWETSADMAVHPDFQGRGIARVLNELRDRGFEENRTVGLNTESQNAAAQHMDGPPRNQRPLTVWTRQRTARRFAITHYRAGGLRQVASAVTGVLRQRRLRRQAETGLASGQLGQVGQVERLERFDAATDELWAQARREFDMASYREARYLNWRHLDPRGGATVTLALRDADRCLGYAVFKPAGRAVNVVDLLAVPGDATVVAALLSAGVEQLGAEGYSAFTSWLPSGHAYEDGFRRAGFIESGVQPFRFAVQLLDRGPAEARRILVEPASRFHVTMSDFDYF